MTRVRASYDAMADRYVELFADELASPRPERGLIDCLAAEVLPRGGPVADLGCGPAHATRYLADKGVPAIGIDLSPRMVTRARERHPDLDLRVGTMTALELPDGALAGALAIYSLIHLPPEGRALAYREFGRVIRSGGWLLVSFHISAPDHPEGSSVTLTDWQGVAVDLPGNYLSRAEVSDGLEGAGFEERARLERGPWSPEEVPSRRCYLLMQKR